MAAAMSVNVWSRIGFVGRNLTHQTRQIVVADYSTARRSKKQDHYGSLVSTSLPDVDSEIEKVSPHSMRGKAMRAMEKRLQRFSPLPAPREAKMTEDQEWAGVYPTAASFKWSAVPLPIRMGFPVRRGIPPHKFANLELVKIPNFLHLTPPAIKKHCAALKELCSEWPAGLETEEDFTKHFPLEREESDYVFASPSLRHPRSRGVTMRIKLSSLNLNKHSRWKFIQLVGDKYDKETDILTLSADRCPVKKQNYEYCIYLLSVLYHEAWITEPWESEITDEDMEEYVWDCSPSKASIISTLARIQDKTSSEVDEKTAQDLLGRGEVQKYAQSVAELRNAEESIESLERYKQAVLNLVHTKPAEADR